ncbi:MAG: hypothetical protein CM15mP129_05840 [Chloroflexota bacterium]|nr:MAG: hypothetical protein CM15mP129_05840 [Chloroflexota bacterium]
MLLNYLKILINKVKKRDFKWLILEVLSKVTLKKLELRIDKVVEKKRIILSSKISKIYNNTVQQGPFKGMVINEDQFWGPGDRSSKILGLYEKEIQDLIVSIQKDKNYSTFVDIGGADGFFAIGSLVNNLFEKCEVFEISKKGRISIQKNSKQNNVYDSIKIHDKASKKSLIKIDNINNSLILCDIEGGEIQLFDEKLINEIYPSDIIIEIHKDKENSLVNFEKRFTKSYSLTKITQEPRSLKNFKELENINDNNRALITSEGRSYVQEWWHLSPK